MTKAEIWEFVNTNEKFRDAINDKAMELISEHFPDEEENDLPLSPGEWRVSVLDPAAWGVKPSVFAPGEHNPIAVCEGPNAEADAKAIAGMKEIIRAALDLAGYGRDGGLRCLRLRQALEDAGIDMEADDDC